MQEPRYLIWLQISQRIFCWISISHPYSDFHQNQWHSKFQMILNKLWITSLPIKRNVFHITKHLMSQPSTRISIFLPNFSFDQKFINLFRLWTFEFSYSFPQHSAKAHHISISFFFSDFLLGFRNNEEPLLWKWKLAKKTRALLCLSLHRLNQRKKKRNRFRS